MNIKLSCILGILLLSLAIVSDAQPIRTSTVEQMLEVASQSEAKGDYVNAIEWYENAMRETKDYTLNPIVAELYTKIKDYKRARGYYERIFKREREENQYLMYRKQPVQYPRR